MSDSSTSKRQLKGLKAYAGGSNAPAAPAPASKPSVATSSIERPGPKLGDFMKRPHDAAIDVMRVCNQIKRMSSLAIAASVTGHPVEVILEKAQGLTDTVLDVLGFDARNPDRLDAVRPMMMEAVCSMMADAAKDGDDPLSADGSIEKALISVARSRGMARAIDRAWPVGVDDTAALRVAAINALTPVMLETMNFDFFHDRDELLREAGSILYEVVHIAVQRTAPESATPASRMVLTQSLLQSGGRVLGAVWSEAANKAITEVHALNEQDLRVHQAKMKSVPTKELLQSVRKEFTEVFLQMVSISDNVLGWKSGPTSTPQAKQATASVTKQRVTLRRRPGGA